MSLLNYHKVWLKQQTFFLVAASSFFIPAAITRYKETISKVVKFDLKGHTSSFIWNQMRIFSKLWKNMILVRVNQLNIETNFQCYYYVQRSMRKTWPKHTKCLKLSLTIIGLQIQCLLEAFNCSINVIEGHVCLAEKVPNCKGLKIQHK